VSFSFLFLLLLLWFCLCASERNFAEPEPETGPLIHECNVAAEDAPQKPALAKSSDGEIPVIPGDLPKFSTLRSGVPSPTLMCGSASYNGVHRIVWWREADLVCSVHTVDLVYAYAYCKLLYNGSWGSTPQDAIDVADCALNLSTVLADPARAAASLQSLRDAVKLRLLR
jgi:hypothetical protein